MHELNNAKCLPARMPVWSMLQCLVEVDDPQLALQILTTVHASLYMDDPGRLNLDENWNKYLHQESLAKGNEQEPHYYRNKLLTWVQNKYVNLGASTSLVRLISSADWHVQMAAIELGIALLQNGNSNMQESVLRDFENPTMLHTFLASVSDYLSRVPLMISDRSRLLQIKRDHLQIGSGARTLANLEAQISTNKNSKLSKKR